MPLSCILVLTKWNSVQKSHLAAGVAPMRCRCSTSQGERTVSPRVSIYNRNMHDVVVYSRQGCHLCDVVKETLRKLQDKADYRWREVDIDADRELQQKYNDEVPVVLINGRKAFKYHMSVRDFLRVLAENQYRWKTRSWNLSISGFRLRGKCRIGEIFSSCVNCRRHFQLLGSLSFMLCGPT